MLKNNTNLVSKISERSLRSRANRSHKMTKRLCLKTTFLCSKMAKAPSKEKLSEESQQQWWHPTSLLLLSLPPLIQPHLFSLTKRERRRRPRKRISSKSSPKKSFRCKMTTKWSLARSHDRPLNILMPMIFCSLMANRTWCFPSLTPLIKVLRTTKEKTFKSMFVRHRPSLLDMLQQLVFRRLVFLVIWLQMRVCMLWWAGSTK